MSISGTKLKNYTTYISSGIPSLDHVVGGGLPAGSILMIEEDVLNNYCRVMSKYFLAEGVVCNHSMLIATLDEHPEDLVQELPQPCTIAPEDEAPNTQLESDVNRMKIAWRYEGLGQVESSFGQNATFGHHFDLSKHLSSESLKNCDINYWVGDHEEETPSGFQNIQYLSLLQKIKELTSKEEYQTNYKGKQNILRICILSLGSPLWMALDCDEENADPRNYGQDLLKFMYCLRVIIRDTNSLVFVTSPTHLFDEDTLIKRLQYSVDNAVKLESFAGSSRETNPVFKDYNGLFHITKLSAINSMVPFVPPSLDLAFKLRRKKFIIEKLHLPPELSETSEREQDDIILSPVSCGGFKKKDIEF